MNSLQSSLYTAALALCLFSTGLLGGRKSKAGASFAYFTGFLVIESLGFIFELLMAHPATPLKALWLGLRMSSSLLVAPCLWLAIKEIVEGVRPKFSSLGRGQIWLIGIGIGSTLPLIASAHLGINYYNPAYVVSPLHSRAIHGAMLLCIAIFGCQVPFYLGRCRRILLQQLDRQKMAAHGADGSAVAWLHLPLVIVFTTWLLGLLRTVHCASHAPQEFAMLFSFTDVSVTVGAIYMIVRRASLPGLRMPLSVNETVTPDLIISQTPDPLIAIVPCPTALAREPATITDAVFKPPNIEIPAGLLNKSAVFPEPVATPLPVAEASAEVRTKSKYARSNLPPAVRERIKRKLQTALTNGELYRNSLLNLRSLSASIKENAHYVSQVINQELNSSFYELINQPRIEEAKKWLVDSPGQTVLEIGMAVGFNSKSTFNAAFRRQTGQTPSEYRASHTKNRANGRSFFARRI